LTVSWTLPHQTLFPLPLVRVNKSCDNHLSTIIASTRDTIGTTRESPTSHRVFDI
jgi:hypothetical protein